MSTTQQHIRESLITFLLGLPAESGPRRPRDARIEAEDLYRDICGKLKRFFDAYEIPVGHATDVLVAIARRVGKDGVLRDAAGRAITDQPAFGAVLYEEARRVLDDVLRAEAAGQQNLMRMLERRAAAQQGGRPAHRPEKTAEVIYWEWIERCANFFVMHRADPPRGLASLVLRRLARSIDAGGVLRDRNHQEVGNIDAYLERTMRNVLFEHRRGDRHLVSTDVELEGRVTPEIEVDEESRDEEVLRECTRGCLAEIRNRHPDQCSLLLAYDEAGGITDNDARAAQFIRLADALKKKKALTASRNAEDAPAMSARVALDYLRVNVHRTRERLGTVFHDCIQLCVEKSG